jgi:putative GTP pyrophosphokinase
MAKLTRAQIDKIGERLVKGAAPGDVQAYFELRDMYAPALADIEERLRRLLPASPPAARLKTVDSVIDKLRRKAARRLSTVQDIAGCRVVVADVVAQGAAVNAVAEEFGKASRIHDSRWRSGECYRAVHVVVEVDLGAGLKGQVEIQIRTELQISGRKSQRSSLTCMVGARNIAPSEPTESF